MNSVPDVNETPETESETPLDTVPISAATLSWLISLRAFWAATPGSFCSSSLTSWILRPIAPPRLFHISTAISKPCVSFSAWAA